MRVTIEHKCGHEHQHTVYAAMTDALLQSFQTAVCPSCARRGNVHKPPPVFSEQTPTKCTECGSACTVPFKPAADRPVYCRVCYVKNKYERKRG